MTIPKLVARFNRYPVGAFVALSTALFGLAMLNPYVQTFALFPTYALMARYAPENVWGLGFFSAGVLMLLGILGGLRRVHYAGALSVVGARLFMLTFVGLQTEWKANSIPDFSIWAAMALFCLVHAYRDARP